MKGRFSMGIALSLPQGFYGHQRLTKSKEGWWCEMGARILKGTGYLFNILFCLLLSNLTILWSTVFWNAETATLIIKLKKHHKSLQWHFRTKPICILFPLKKIRYFSPSNEIKWTFENIYIFFQLWIKKTLIYLNCYKKKSHEITRLNWAC